MKLLTHVLLIILWSSILSLDVLAASEKVNSNTSTAIPSEAFTIYKNLTNFDSSFTKVVENMPAIQSQDTVGSCFGCASATIVQKFLCDSDPEIKKSAASCSELPREKRISQLSLVAWADTNKPTQTPGDNDNHKNLRLYEDRTSFSSGSNALMNSIDMFEFMPESCFPFDQLVSKYGSKDSSLFKNVYEKTKQLFGKMKAATEGGNFQCEECLAQLNTDFNTTFTPEALSSAVKKESYGEFLYFLLFNNCKPLSSNARPTYKQFPGKKATADKKEVFNKIKEVLDKNKPVLLSSLCLDYDPGKGACKSNHDTVISGYRKACPDGDKNSSQCRTQLKIHNCWGQDWQNANNDGWVDSAKLIEFMNEKKDYIEAGDLSWLE